MTTFVFLGAKYRIDESGRIFVFITHDREVRSNFHSLDYARLIAHQDKLARLFLAEYEKVVRQKHPVEVF